MGTKNNNPSGNGGTHSKDDNPVPSLDSKELKYIIDLLKNNTLFKIEQPYQKRYRTKIIQKLVNGVETDNGQPQCTCRKCNKKFTFGICYKCENNN